MPDKYLLGNNIQYGVQHVWDINTLEWVKMVQPVINADTVVEFQTASTSSSVTQVSSNVSSVTLAASNDSRKHLTVFNDSEAVLYLKCGTTASSSSYTVRVQPNGYYDVPDRYTGIVSGAWASADGYAYVTEFT